MTLTFIASLILSVSFIALIIFVNYFLAHISVLFGFKNETKETEATLKGFITRGSAPEPRGANPVLEYYNEFLGQNIKKEMFNSGIIASENAVTKRAKQRIANVGDKIKVQYTAKRVRVIDPKFVTNKTYKISRFILPIIMSFVIGYLGFILLVISIII